MTANEGRCEPPPELRGVDGWHWVAQAIGADPLAAWWDSDASTWDNELINDNAHWGWRYLAPVTPPAVVTALVEALEGLLNLDTRQEVINEPAEADGIRAAAASALAAIRALGDATDTAPAPTQNAAHL